MKTAVPVAPEGLAKMAGEGAMEELESMAGLEGMAVREVRVEKAQTEGMAATGEMERVPVTAATAEMAATVVAAVMEEVAEAVVMEAATGEMVVTEGMVAMGVMDDIC